MTQQTDAIMTEISAALREQQVGHGYTAEMDDTLTFGELGRAAVAYITLNKTWWPFGERGWKPRGRRDDLIRAAALIVAEIARVDRMKGKYR